MTTVRKPFETAALCPQDIASALDRAVALGPDIEAVIGADARYTFSELRDETDRIRAALVASGVRRGEHVGICLPNSARWVALFFAIGSIGAIAVPVNTRLLADELHYIFNLSKIRRLVVVDRFLKIDFLSILREILPGIDDRLPDAACPLLEEIILVGDDVPMSRNSDSLKRVLSAMAVAPSRASAR